MDGPRLHYEHMQAASHDIREAAGHLRERRDALTQQFDGVVGADWTGEAAASFGAVFAEWCTGLRDVEQGLEAMSDLIGATMQDFHETDNGAEESMHSISARIVDRLR